MMTLDEIRQYRGVLLDLDGTLVDFVRNYASFASELAVQFEVQDEDSFLREYHLRIASSGVVSFESSIAGALAAVGAPKPGGFDSRVRGAIQSYAEGISRLPHAGALLEALRDVPKAIVSNGPSDMQRAALAQAELVEHFDAIVVSGDADVAIRKPQAEIFHLACSRIGCDPCEAIMIGDNETADILGATNAGLAAIHIRDLQF